MSIDYSFMIEKFAETHPGWDRIVPPPEGAASGSLRQPEGSGLVRYVFDVDERGPYLEYYSFHRIWGDSHARIYGSGEVDRLDTIGTNYVTSDDPEEDKRRQDRLHEYNLKLLAELDAAGLLSGGPVPGSFTINAAIVTGAVDPDDPKADEDA